MKKLSFMLAFFMLAINYSFAQQAKYVFYFIGDGMGVNQVQATELFQAELQNKIGIVPLKFAQFPYITMATTYSATNGVTDSAASGTALATGNKTKNGTLGLLKDWKTEVNSVAVWAKEAGHRVGIATSVSVDHATPAAFYAHVPKRKMYHQIGKQLYEANFDFYAGSDFRKPVDKDDPNSANLYNLAKENGYTIARGYEDYVAKSKTADKLILFQSEEASKKSRSSIPYAIDRTDKDLTLEQITTSAIDFMSKDLSKGFFLMIEGGKIDWACHSNDAATAIREVQDFDNAIKIAYNFYMQHPDETLIVITADHETGGMVLGTGAYKLNLQALQYQKVSEEGFTDILQSLRKKHNNKVSWEMVKAQLKANFGFWGPLEVSEKQEAYLKKVYTESFKNEDVDMTKSEYADNEPVASAAKEVISEIALIGWTSGGHSAGYVPVCAVGAGAHLFQGRLDNALLPIRIAEAAGYPINK